RETLPSRRLLTSLPLRTMPHSMSSRISYWCRARRFVQIVRSLGLSLFIPSELRAMECRIHVTGKEAVDIYHTAAPRPAPASRWIYPADIMCLNPSCEDLFWNVAY